MGRFFLHGTFGGAALRDIGERVVWNRQAMGRAISSCFVVERPLVRVLCSRRLGRLSIRDRFCAIYVETENQSVHVSQA